MINWYELKAYKLLKKIWYKVFLSFSKKKGVRYIVNDFKFRMPVSCYKYMQFKYFPSNYESENFKFFRKHASQGITCIDIGAHIGLFSVFMCKEANANVFSFEPTITSQEIFRDLMVVNKCADKVKLIPGAVSGKSGKATFYMSDTPLWVGNSLLKENFGAVNIHGHEVDVYSVDEFVAQNDIPVHFIKIDAEGAELDILKGARNTFLKYKPSGILGIHPSTFTDKPGTYEKIWDTLMEYELSVFFENQELPRAQFMGECLDKKDPFDLQFIDNKVK